MAGSKKKTHIWSIFGQIDAVIARAMVEEGKFKELPYNTIPISQRFGDKGEIVELAVVVPQAYVLEYEERVAKLRA